MEGAKFNHWLVDCINAIRDRDGIYSQVLQSLSGVPAALEEIREWIHLQEVSAAKDEATREKSYRNLKTLCIDLERVEKDMAEFRAWMIAEKSSRNSRDKHISNLKWWLMAAIAIVGAITKFL